jgi:hypothetical protein
MKSVTKISCDVCGKEQECKTGHSLSNQHNMIIFSYVHKEANKRVFVDFCSYKCFIKAAKSAVTEYERAD